MHIAHAEKHLRVYASYKRHLLAVKAGPGGMREVMKHIYTMHTVNLNVHDIRFCQNYEF